MNTRRAVLIVVLAIVLLPLVVKAADWLVLQIRIDDCLDSGGRWNYQTGGCERR